MARHAVEVFGERLRFVRYNRSTGRFLPVAPHAAEALFAAASAPGPHRRGGKGGPLREVGRRLERAFRHGWRAVLRRAAAAAGCRSPGAIC